MSTTEDQKFNFHNNAAALIIAAAERSGLLNIVANALYVSNEYTGSVSGCFACNVLDELTEHFDEHFFLPNSDFYGEGVVLPDYTDEQLRSYLEVPFELPLSAEEVADRMRALKGSHGMGMSPKTAG